MIMHQHSMLPKNLLLYKIISKASNEETRKIYDSVYFKHQINLVKLV